MSLSLGIHTNGLPYVEQGGHRRILACLAPTRSYAFPRFASPILPRDQWKECSLRSLGAKILDQNGHGSCVGHGSCSAFTYAWRYRNASPHDFSACFLYGNINGGSDNGAVVGDALESLQSTGICLESEVPENDIFSRDFPRSSYDTAKRFKIEQAYHIETFDEIATAVQLGFAVSIGVEIGQAFEPDGQGVLPELSGGGGGHCMCVLGLKSINGRWYLEVQNSWGASWGAGGFCWMPESYFRGQTDHWAVQACAEDPQEPVEPPAPM
jgi:hypothetical protein